MRHRLRNNLCQFQFQSAPTPEGGRCLADLEALFGPNVSIRSHPGGWEMPAMPVPHVLGLSFQSAPTPEGGRCHR